MLINLKGAVVTHTVDEVESMLKSLLKNSFQVLTLLQLSLRNGNHGIELLGKRLLSFAAFCEVCDLRVGCDGPALKAWKGTVLALVKMY